MFCQLTAYKAGTRGALLRGLQTYLSEMTVLPPSSWDNKMRLEPPKNPPTLETRLVNRVAIRDKIKFSDEKDEEDEADADVEVNAQDAAVGVDGYAVDVDEKAQEVRELPPQATPVNSEACGE